MIKKDHIHLMIPTCVDVCIYLFLYGFDIVKANGHLNKFINWLT